MARSVTQDMTVGSNKINTKFSGNPDLPTVLYGDSIMVDRFSKDALAAVGLQVPSYF